MKLKLLSFIILFVFAGNIISNAQDNITISGNISSSTGEYPLPGASVLIKGTSTGVVTDFDGNYEITVSSNSLTLSFSFQGFKTKEVNIGTQTTINVTLDEDVSNLDEVVLIGYGSSKRKDLTGSISSIKSDDLENVKVISADEFLQGRVSGLVLTQTSGQPGGASSIRIRGTSSINAGNEPLYVIDGFPINNNNNDVSSGVTEGPRMSALSSISPSEIESIDVLKDASATAIYGSRGANGVIIIKTKRGFNGDGKISFNSYLGVQTVNKELNLLNASQFAHYINEANYNSGLPRTYANPEVYGEGTDWQNELFREALVTNYDISFKGGSEKIKYAVSGSYLNQEGVIEKTDFNRANFRANLDFKVNEWLSIQNTFGITQSKFNTINTEGGLAFGRGSLVATAYAFNPMLPVFDGFGNYTKANYVVDNDGSFDNSVDNRNFQNGFAALLSPIATLNLFDSEGRTTRIIENLALDFKLSSKFNFKTTLGIDMILNEEAIFRTAEIDFTANREASAVKAKQLSTNWLTELTLNYLDVFNDIHKVSAFVGFSAQEFETDALNAIVADFPIENFGADNLGLGIDHKSGSKIIRKSFISYFGRVNYTLNYKYIFTFTGRYDGASVFGPNTKYGFFPSGAFAWNLYDEEFIQNMNVFSHLKLRLGYGEVGNAAIPPYSALSRYKTSYHYFGDTPAQGLLPHPNSPANSDLAWERTKQFNIGLDMNFFDDRIGLSFDIYDKKTEDLLLLLPTPINTGYQSVMVNVGDVKNTGFEIALNTSNFTGDFNWETNFTFAYNKNEIVSLAGLDQIATGSGVISEWQRLVEGGEIGAFYGYVSNGIAQLDDDVSSIPHFTTETLVPGERMYKDLNNDGIITVDDKTFIGNALPEISYGINNSFNYKSFDLNIFFQGVYGNDIVNFNRYNLEGLDGYSNVTLEAFSNRWTPDNPSNKYTRALTGGRTNQFSDHIVEDGDYLRLKSVTFGYSIPSKYLSKIKLDKMKLYVTGKDLLTFTNYSGVNPDVSMGGQNNSLSAGGDYGGYPSTKTVLFGINLSF